MHSEELNREFVRLKDAAYRYAVSLLHDHNEAADATQDCYERLWRRRLIIRSKSFDSLVMVTIRNICLDRIRQRRRAWQPSSIEELESLPPSLGSAEQRESADIIRRVMENLPSREREVLHLRECEGMEFEDIARIVGSTESAVRMACSRARNRVKEEYIKIMNYGV